MASKNLITLTVPTAGGKDRIYEGRFLGFIKDDEFNAMAQEKDAAAKVESRETKDMVGICRAMDDVEGMRLVLTAKKINGKNTKTKTLFISEKLTMIREVSTTNVTFMLDNGDDMLAEEKD